jgi:hypothetical protein
MNYAPEGFPPTAPPPFGFPFTTLFKNPFIQISDFYIPQILIY